MIHTVYGGAHLFKSGLVAKFGKLALATLEKARPECPDEILTKIRRKLENEPIEDYRIDFEDGYGPRSDAEEDADAERAGEICAAAALEQTLPRGIGVRPKGFGTATERRAKRTLDFFFRGYFSKKGARLPLGFLVTLPKVETPAEVKRAVAALVRLEKRHRLPVLGVELMVETPEALECLPALVRAAGSRCRALHYGAYDYLSRLDVPASAQTLDHPFSDFARWRLKQIGSALGVEISDGATTQLPVGSREEIQEAWKLHGRNIRRAIGQGVFRGWDLHPAQLVARYATVYQFFAANLADYQGRLRRFVDQAARARLSGQVFDDAATALGLVAFFDRGLCAGALLPGDLEPTGLSEAQVRGRNPFVQAFPKG